MSKHNTWLAVAVAIAVAAPAVAKESAQDALAAALGPMLESHQGEVTVAVKHLKTGRTYLHNADKPMSSASLIKAPVMLTAYRLAALGQLSLDDPVTLREEDKVPGSGLLTPHFSNGIQVPLRDVIHLMIAWSDNTATNLAIEAIGRASKLEGETDAARGIAETNDLMEKLGYENIRLNSLVYRGDTTIAPDRSEAYGLGLMSAAETLDLFEKLAKGDPGDGIDDAVVEAYRAEMLDHLRACQYNDMVPRYLPKGTVVAHKTGGVSNARCDAGLIESPTGLIAYCVMTDENADLSWEEDAAPHVLIAQIGKAAYDYFTQGAGAVDAPRVARVLRMGQEDPLVVPLQRTLNRRVKPSPKLATDGDYGPNTQKAVKAFQKQAKIAVTGEVDAATWKALGPLAMSDDPVPPPAEALKDLSPLLPVDPLGQPVTTCPAWAIADGETGKLLWGKDDSVVRDPASTTKIMTAHLVCRLAQQDAKVLDEVVTFSERADKTSGSTADLREGEQVSAGELLYGLMLPSGNDASVAFAEHFGARLPGEEGDTPYDRFIAAMNAEARRLGMNETGYRNTHGLTAEGHVTSARDLVKLAHAAMQDGTFREVVATRRYATTVSSTTGYQRNVVWNNTDQLLKREGFYGVKTGTTGPAGACLVSAGERDGKPLYVVVLGANSGSNRYLDARNLYRWAWNQLGAK
ncbi:D-alanyl-D-alanine carboxypeptidase DacB precursor [Planctomycetes bacterium MalM25]|nr:D-alanyl-D-alanine carboxypeptidase DacB precursor [Planctomycetes bacterium MalM25]